MSGQLRWLGSTVSTRQPKAGGGRCRWVLRGTATRRISRCRPSPAMSFWSVRTAGGARPDVRPDFDRFCHDQRALARRLRSVPSAEGTVQGRLLRRVAASKQRAQTTFLRDWAILLAEKPLPTANDPTGSLRLQARIPRPTIQLVAAAALPCWSVQSTTRRITSPRLASKAAVTASVESELTGVAFSKRVVATGVRRGMRSKVASSTTVACGVPEASFSTWNFLRFDSSKKSVAKVWRDDATTGRRPVFWNDWISKSCTIAGALSVHSTSA